MQTYYSFHYPLVLCLGIDVLVAKYPGKEAGSLLPDNKGFKRTAETMELCNGKLWLEHIVVDTPNFGCLSRLKLWFAVLDIGCPNHNLSLYLKQVWVVLQYYASS